MTQLSLETAEKRLRNNLKQELKEEVFDEFSKVGESIKIEIGETFGRI